MIALLIVILAIAAWFVGVKADSYIGQTHTWHSAMWAWLAGALHGVVFCLFIFQFIH